MNFALIALLALLGLGLSLGIGWLVFRRVLMPQTETKLKPSGAHPWSRTRVPVPESQAHIANAGMASPPANGNAAPSPAFNAGFGPGASGLERSHNGFAGPNVGSEPLKNNGPAPNMPGRNPMANNGFNASAPGFAPPVNNGFEQHRPGPGPQGNGYGRASNGYSTPATGFGGFSDSFVPPSPQIFSTGDASVGLPGTGVLPVPAHGNGFAPASNAFNAMYGLPDDPFAASQSGSPGWLESLNAGNTAGSRQRSAPTNGLSSEADMQDPYLADVIRQYSQRGQAMQQQQFPPLPQPEQGAGPGFQNSQWIR